MDTKRNKKEEEKRRAALKAKELIESWKPGVVITADDNAAKYLLQPYFRDHKIPFVFCGVNWNVDEYGFPYSEDDMTIASAIIALAKNLSLAVVAEGVESDYQLDFLKRHGCDKAQGFLISRPLPVKQMGDILQRNKI
jgi:hypothetical protein